MTSGISIRVYVETLLRVVVRDCERKSICLWNSGLMPATLGEHSRIQGHQLHYVAVCVSNVQRRCIVVILLHVQSLLDACPVGSEELDDVGVQQVVHILAHADVDLRGRYSCPIASRSFRPGSSRRCTLQRSLGRSRGTFLRPTGGSCEVCRSSMQSFHSRPPARELPCTGCIRASWS